jgi:hypothetical protein
MVGKFKPIIILCEIIGIFQMDLVHLITLSETLYLKANTMNSYNFKKKILEKLNTVLKPRRFKKNQNIFSFSNKDLTYYICVQSRGDSTTDVLKTTVNIEIASSKLTYLDDMSIPGYLQRHFVKNIGNYSGMQQDKWWTIDNEAAALSAELEIADIITNKVLPEMDELKTTNDLAGLWQKHVSPGLTKYQSREYLSLLRMTK